ncbi:pirin family protein [Aeromicrobium phragmitis]|uniref:Pirin family protein n=1 Tax=Aeromicrobium phragmitis TaxID=2478914 RepID=A0A3L8PK75_9ACTN|nr:pirin family protein [Aeromicrobium phragmitis]RLV55711.1 pirin family protein [Aeromicrobium phragmitis]
MIGDHTIPAREVPLGGIRQLTVHRTLPSRGLPTIGPWCFVDHFGPTSSTMTVLPHPHTGLQTVTWPITGRIRHRDNLGSDVILEPGELNLMTSGDGVSHSEFSVVDDDLPADMHGIQLWVALPDAARHGPAAFEHHPDLPRAEGQGWRATVLVGDFGGVRSGATVHSPALGVELRLQPGTHDLPVAPAFEHGVLAVDAELIVAGETLAHRDLRYLAPGRDTIRIEVEQAAIVMLLGGEPFEEELVMWWNFIGRTHEEVARAREDWQAQAARFGHVDGHDGAVIPAPPMPDVRLRPRRRLM